MGRGGAGKSTAATRLGQLTGLPVIELDKHFWRQGLAAMPLDEWIQAQRILAAECEWIIDGDLGPHDALAPRLERADTIVILDFSLIRCVWRAARRSRERADFWWWLLTWRRRSRPSLLDAVSKSAPTADLHVLRTPRELRQFFAAADVQA